MFMLKKLQVPKPMFTQLLTFEESTFASDAYYWTIDASVGASWSHEFIADGSLRIASSGQGYVAYAEMNRKVSLKADTKYVVSIQITEWIPYALTEYEFTVQVGNNLLGVSNGMDTYTWEFTTVDAETDTVVAINVQNGGLAFKNLYVKEYRT